MRSNWVWCLPTSRQLQRSLFATEGVASLGLFWAPLGTFVCGLILALWNWASSRLPPVMVAVSSCVLVQVLLNAPLSTTLLSNGGAILFLLWSMTPEPAAMSMVGSGAAADERNPVLEEEFSLS